MRKTLYAIIGFIAIPFFFAACLDDDTNYSYSSDAIISAFSIDDIETDVEYIDDDGDTITSTITVTGEDYVFLIDQNENRIYNSDSLPVGTDVTKVVTSVSIIGYAVVYEKEGEDTLWTSTDSIDFTEPVKFTVYAYDGTTRSYTVEVNVHQQEPDSLQWSQVEGANFNVSTIYRQKAVSFNDKIIVFAESSGQVQVTYTDMTDGVNWSTPQDIGIEGADYSSVIVYNDCLYILAQNQLYTSTDGTSWSSAGTSQSLSQLFATNSSYIYGISNNMIVESEDALSWTEVEEAIDNFPTYNVSYATCTLPTNSQIERTVVFGASEKVDTATIMLGKLSTESTWTQYNVSLDNIYACPKLKELAIIHYDDKLYAFGGEKDFTSESPIKAFEALYESTDHGITWKAKTEDVTFPEEFLGRTDYFSYTVDSDNYIWIMWSGSNEVWKGKINRLGFIIQ